MTYVMKSAKSHMSILWSRVPIDEALKDPRLTTEQKAKLEQAKEARDFALSHIRLKPSDNYTRFSYVDRPYVSYVVSAAPKWKLEHHEWSYPIVGKMPYRGFASEEDAKAEQGSLDKENLDTYLRGVSAYSTLGWFEDPILSTMLSSSEQGLVDVIIHETTHATLYIKNSADFNERLAVFVGNKGTEEFYLAKEGADSPTVAKIKAFNHDDALFSAFIGPKIQELKSWYAQLPETERQEERRKEKFKAIQEDFEKNLLPRMKTEAYKRFPRLDLNNARLLYFKTYMTDLSDFEKLYASTGNSWELFLKCAKTLESAKKPEDGLKELLKKIETSSVQEICRS
ncbi:MAG: aminopeptidase [Bdellovibrionaceae bacterium]|nr:aminopeptidase [Pseudobdellovibrionaceae bacterium]